MDFDLERQLHLQTALTEANLDALLCAAPSPVLLLTGYWPIMGASIALVTRSGEVHLIAPEDEADLARATSAATLTTYTPGTLDTLLDPVEALSKPLLALLNRLSLTHAQLGMELGYAVQPASYLTQVQFRSSLVNLLQERLPDLRITACEPLLERLKAVKTPRELDQIRRACTLAKGAFDTISATVLPGIPEMEVAATLYANFERSLLHPSGSDADRNDGYFFCMSGPNSATASAAYARTRSRLIVPDDLVMIHSNTCHNGFWTDITRTVTAPGSTASHPAPDLHREIRAAITEARAAALAVIRPGTLARDVDAAVRQVMTQHGFGPQFVHGTGHGVGFAAANGNALPRIHPGSPDILETGMTFNIEPAAYFPGIGGMRHCDVVAVTPTGVEVLTDF